MKRNDTVTRSLLALCVRRSPERARAITPTLTILAESADDRDVRAAARNALNAISLDPPAPPPPCSQPAAVEPPAKSRK